MGKPYFMIWMHLRCISSHYISVVSMACVEMANSFSRCFFTYLALSTICVPACYCY